MSNNRQYSGWMAEQIAKLYLYETELLDVYQSDSQKFDFVCMFKEDMTKTFGVEVKSSKYSKRQIIKVYSKVRNESLRVKIPILMLYINYEDKTGYFEFIYDRLNEDLTVLTTQNLKLALINFKT